MRYVNQTVNFMEKSALVISDRAAQKMNAIGYDGKEDDRKWRLALVRTHCMMGRGYAYRVSFETPTQLDRQLSKIGTVEVYAPESDVTRLSGSEIDYLNTLQAEGFVVKNPNARSKCPCGHHDIFD